MSASETGTRYVFITIRVGARKGIRPIEINKTAI